MSVLTATVRRNILAIPRHENDAEIAQDLLADIEAGKCTAVDIGREFGTLVYEVRGADLIVHAIYSNYVECDMTLVGMKLAEEIRLKNNCSAIRCDTRRAGLLKKLLSHGWVVDSVAISKQN